MVSFSFGQSPQQLEAYINGQTADLIQLYKYYHQNPELSFEEVETAKRMAEELRQLGFEVSTDIGGHGLVGVYKNGEGPTLMIRADMDALPIIEETGKDYASTVTKTDASGQKVGIMHACGHDMHMTVWTGTARSLIAMKDKWKGTLVFIGQPAEERSGGAKEMLADGLFERFPRPDYALALHVSANMAAGKVGYHPGYVMANVDMIDITVYGKGGHGAYPHTTKDPVVLAARLIMDFQTIVSREISPREPAVLTVGSIHGGSKGNVIPDDVKMELTIRSYTDEVRNLMVRRIEEICQGVALSAGLEEQMYPKVEVRSESTPALFNDPKLTARVGKVFKQVLGAERVEDAPPVMAGEDFGRYGREAPRIPIMLYWLGAVEPELVAAAERGEIQLPSLHSSKFAPLPEPTIQTGVLTMTSAALELLKK
ncbi:MAG: amidohydrolase [Bacteroidota bacterium]